MDIDDLRVERLMRRMPDDYAPAMIPNDQGQVIGEHVLPNGGVIRLAYVRPGDPAGEAICRDMTRHNLWRIAELARLGVDLPPEWTMGVN